MTKNKTKPVSCYLEPRLVNLYNSLEGSKPTLSTLLNYALAAYLGEVSDAEQLCLKELSFSGKIREELAAQKRVDISMRDFVRIGRCQNCDDVSLIGPDPMHMHYECNLLYCMICTDIPDNICPKIKRVEKKMDLKNPPIEKFLDDSSRFSRLNRCGSCDFKQEIRCHDKLSGGGPIDFLWSMKCGHSDPGSNGANYFEISDDDCPLMKKIQNK